MRIAQKTEITTPQKRLHWLLGARRPQPWGQRLGLQSSTISKMMREGHLPTARFLERIQRAENVSLSWLLTGEGPPFLVTSGTPDQVMQAIRAALEEPGPGWSVYVPITAGQLGLLLYRQVELDAGLPPIIESRIFGGRDLHATYTEALVGNLQLLERSQRPAWAVYLEVEEWDQLTTGWWPSWLLFGEALTDRPLFGRSHQKLKSHQDLAHAVAHYFQTSELAEEAARYSDDQEILAAYRALDESGREQALRVIRAMQPPASEK